MTEGLLLVGCGKMGGALLAGWLASSPRAVSGPIAVVEPTEAAVARWRSSPDVTLHAAAESLPGGFAPDRKSTRLNSSH